MPTRVVLLASDPGLKRGLSAQLRSRPGLTLADDVVTAAGSVVLAPPRDCPVERCASLVAAGAAVVIVAPVWRDAERLRYEAAGARAYLPMGFDFDQLAKVLAG